MRPGMLACIAATAACSFTAPNADTVDAARHDGDGDNGSDAGSDADVTQHESCQAHWMDHTIQFGAPVALTSANSPTVDRDPFLSADELTLIFSSDRPPSMSADIWIATRGTVGDAFPAPTQLPGAINTADYEGKMSFTDDGLLAVISTSHQMNQGPPGGSPPTDTNIWQATRDDTGMPYMAPTFDHLANVNTTASEYDALITPNGLHLYFAPTDAVNQHLAFTTRNGLDDDWNTPTPIAELNSGNGEADPALSLDELVITFSASRPSSHAGINLWYATRSAIGDTFGTASEIPGVNGDGNDGDGWLSRDFCRMYFASDVGGSYDLYMASSTAP